jgi:hypothetical protein
LSDTLYRTVSGFVQFDVNERDVNGRTVRDFLVQQTGSEGKNIRVTLWPEFADVAIEKGDLVFATGKFTTPNIKGKTYLNLSANRIAVVPGLGPSDGVENELGDDEDEETLF